MKADPVSAHTGGSYPGDYLEAVDLHSPFFINGKIRQKLPACFSVYVLVENLLDDYGIDPFNPGPGRMLSVGLDFNASDF